MRLPRRFAPRNDVLTAAIPNVVLPGFVVLPARENFFFVSPVGPEASALHAMPRGCQTFGDRINLHPHLHCLVSEGGEDEQGRFHHLQTFDDSLLAEFFSREVFALLLGEELISEEMVEKILLFPDEDFYTISGTSEFSCGVLPTKSGFRLPMTSLEPRFILSHDG